MPLRGAKRSKRKHVAFSVSAGAYPYQMGLAHYLRTHFDIDAMDVFFSGASGGAWAAVLLASGFDIESTALPAVKRLGPECCKGRWLGAYGVYDQGMRAVFRALFDHVDLATKVNGKLAISVTRLAFSPLPFLKDEVISHFYSNEDIMECIIASALIPFALNGRPWHRFRDW